ncbi:MAG: carboxymuconolactone decarboxylase family protein [Porticoccaceae bacterium]|uniref:carboxymuconolactone decarboxylase family protein n=1 Tax=Thalassospira sp. TaxID=1912094 RepID=UPI003A896607
MIKTMTRLLGMFAVITGFLTAPDAKAISDVKSLDAQQQSIITIAAFTASGDMDRLTPALNTGLDAGLTVNEVKEVLVQMYAYAGFPRSLNAMFALMGILEDRKAKGIVDAEGRDASPAPENFDRDAYGARIRADLSGLEDIPPPAAWQEFSPIIDVFLKEHLFADIFVRDVLDHQQRELATIAALANMPGTAGQLRYHLGAAMNTGLTEAQMRDFILVLGSEVGSSVASDASDLLNEVLGARSQ